MSDETQAANSEVRAGQRIAKVIARAGVCSRRDAEAWIAAGRISVNGNVLSSPAFNVSEADDVRVDGKRLGAPERTRLFLFHKPRGLVTTARDPEGRNTVFAVLPPDLPRVVAIGRLDINTEGLLLLTNDGGLARVLELPSTGWLRRYRVRVHGSIDQAALDRLAGGVTIDGVDYLGVEAKLDREQGANAWLTLGLREGKNREIKKILEHLGLAVNRLIRISFGPFELGDLPEGEVMEVRTRVLRDQLGVKLAKEANANFDAGLVVRDEPAPERQGERQRSERGPREVRGRGPAKPGRPERGARGAESRFERDGPARRAPPKPSTLSAGASMSRPCGPRSWPTSPTARGRASASSAARPMTARAGPSPSSAYPALAKRRAQAARPRRGRRAAHVRTVEAIPRPQARARRGRARAAAAFGPEGVRASAREVQCRERRRRPAGAPLRSSSSEAGRRPPRWPAANAQYRGSDARTQV